MFSCLQILEAFLWFVLITLLNVTLIILTLSVSRLLNLLLRLVAFLLFLNPQCLASISRWITASSSWKRFCLYVQNQNEPQLRDENAHNDKSVHGVLNPTYQAGLRRDAVQPDIEAERKKRDEIEAGKSYCSRRFGGATCDDKSAQIYARFDKNDWRIQPAEFYRFHDAEVNTFGYF